MSALTSPSRVAQEWGVSRRTIARLIEDDELPVIRIRGQIRIPVDAVEEYVARQRGRTSAKALVA